MTRSVIVVLDELPKKETALVIGFLRSEVAGPLHRAGRNIQVEGKGNKHLKQLLNKFLHSRNLASYRTLSGPGVLRIVPIRVNRPTRKEPPVYPPSSYVLPLSKVPGPLGWEPEDIVPALKSKRRVQNRRT